MRALKSLQLVLQDTSRGWPELAHVPPVHEKQLDRPHAILCAPRRKQQFCKAQLPSSFYAQKQSIIKMQSLFLDSADRVDCAQCTQCSFHATHCNSRDCFRSSLAH
eukprot:TRINITY_DN14579_c0_g1_i1.p2 TRINITY_DN14579_c0_g1~~TRINITY_DN14579_c0_g1_i1.p2  ORF type:complete len:106 (+),score=15.74 TRINITY_DN14579_c0_g1_i1:1535-1852(+)